MGFVSQSKSVAATLLIIEKLKQRRFTIKMTSYSQEKKVYKKVTRWYCIFIFQQNTSETKGSSTNIMRYAHFVELIASMNGILRYELSPPLYTDCRRCEN